MPFFQPKPRHLVVSLLAALSGPLSAQDAVPSRWTFTVASGPAIGGPSGAMTDRFLDEGWTEDGCNTKGVDCHANPIRQRPSIHFSFALGRRLGRWFEADAVVAMGSLGQSFGRKNGYDVSARWSSATIGAVLAVKPIEQFRIGAGPLLAMLMSDTPGTIPNSVVRSGFLLATELRSSTRKPFFLSLSATYRQMGKRLEGPWPARKAAWYGSQGPSQLNTDYSHLDIGLGFGTRF